MNIFELAIEREKMTERLYLDLAEQTKNNDLKKIFSILANEQARHTHIFQGRKKKISREKIEKVFTSLREILKKIKKTKNLFKITNKDLDPYLKLRDTEKESEKIYRAEANKIINPEIKKSLIDLAAEEREHYFLMDEIIYLLQNSDEWLKSPNFYCLDKT